MSKKQHKKKKKGGDNSGAPAWMTTYSDMVTLLLTFFILMLSFSSVKQGEFEEAISSIKQALGLVNKVAITKPLVRQPLRTRFEESIQEAVEKLQLIPELRNEVAFEKNENGVRVRISNPLLFESGKADLKPESFAVLDTVGTTLAGNIFTIIIEGHTDNVPINNDQFQSNWELSAARAVSVLEYFIHSDIAPYRFHAIAYGEFQPLAENNSAEGRATNRRVEIFIPYENEWVDEIENVAEKGNGSNGGTK